MPKNVWELNGLVGFYFWNQQGMDRLFSGDCQFSVSPWGQECMCEVILMAMDVLVGVGCHLCLFFRAMWRENHRPGQT